jgi:hypothetical protein
MKIEFRKSPYPESQYGIRNHSKADDAKIYSVYFYNFILTIAYGKDKYNRIKRYFEYMNK